MEYNILQVGQRVRVISYSPFRGLCGTVRRVDVDSVSHLAELHCFYLVDLEGAYIQEPVWFEHEEVESVPPSEQGVRIL